MAVKRRRPPHPKSSAPVRRTARPPAKAAARTRLPPSPPAKAPAKARAQGGSAKAARRSEGRAKAAKARAQPTLTQVVLDALADMKAVDVKALDVRGITDITDTMVVASGTSDRHVKSIADRVVQRCKEAGFRPVRHGRRTRRRVGPARPAATSCCT